MLLDDSLFEPCLKLQLLLRSLMPMFRSLCLILAFILVELPHSLGEDLRIPAFTAYMLPDADSARISEERGVIRWKGNQQSVNWYGKFTETGTLFASLELRLPKDKQSKLRLSIDGQGADRGSTRQWPG